MPDPATLAIFVAASLVLIAIPGPSVIFIVTRSLEHGRRAGLVSMLGVEAGACVHVAAAALGLSAILASSATAFTVVKYVGAAYLILLGLQALRRSASRPALQVAKPVTSARLFRQGALINVFNPKVAVFFLAFLPQFVDPARGSVTLQVGLLGFCFVGVAVVSDGAYAMVAGGLGDRLRRSAAASAVLDRISAVVYLTLGVAAALAGERQRPGR